MISEEEDEGLHLTTVNQIELESKEPFQRKNGKSHDVKVQKQYT